MLLIKLTNETALFESNSITKMLKTKRSQFFFPVDHIGTCYAIIGVMVEKLKGQIIIIKHKEKLQAIKKIEIIFPFFQTILPRIDAPWWLK